MITFNCTSGAFTFFLLLNCSSQNDFLRTKTGIYLRPSFVASYLLLDLKLSSRYKEYKIQFYFWIIYLADIERARGNCFLQTSSNFKSFEALENIFFPFFQRHLENLLLATFKRYENSITTRICQIYFIFSSKIKIIYIL